MGISQKDIAQQLGVSTMTVSRVLSDKCGNMVSAKLKQKILEAAKAGNYQVNTMARAMKTGEIPISALCLHLPFNGESEALNEMYWLEILSSYTREFSKNGMEMLFISFASLEELTGRLNVLSRSKLIGSVVANLIPDDQLKKQEVEMIRSLKLPYVILGDSGDETIPQTVMDNTAVPDLILEKLRSRGANKLSEFFHTLPLPPKDDIADPHHFFQVPNLSSLNFLEAVGGVPRERICVVSHDRSVLSSGGFLVNTHIEERCANVYKLLKLQMLKKKLPEELKRITITMDDIQEISGSYKSN